MPVATAVVQLLDARRSIAEAVNVRRLTYIALVFVPLSWVATLFSMAEKYAPGSGDFWVYFATALPLLLLVLSLAALDFNSGGHLVNSLWDKVTRRKIELRQAAA